MEKTLLCISILSATVLLPSCSNGQGGITVSDTETKSSLSLYDRITGFFAGAEKLTKEGKEIKDQIQSSADSQELPSKLGSVWESVKSFFSDKTVRDMLFETGKLFLRLIANIFTLIAGVINKVLSA